MSLKGISSIIKMKIKIAGTICIHYQPPLVTIKLPIMGYMTYYAMRKTKVYATDYYLLSSLGYADIKIFLELRNPDVVAPIIALNITKIIKLFMKKAARYNQNVINKRINVTRTGPNIWHILLNGIDVAAVPK